MIDSENRLFCRLDGLTAAMREQQRLNALTELGLLGSETVPVFEEATQTAAHFLGVPICILGLMAQEYQHYKSAVGLSRLGLMNELTIVRRLPRLETFCTHVVDSQQPLVISDTLDHPAFADSALVHRYNIRAYLGVPLINSSGYCLGTLAVMSLLPHQFSPKDIEFLGLTARWSLSEFERQAVSKVSSPPVQVPPVQVGVAIAPRPAPATNPATHQLKLDLLGQLTQELRTPLTSVLGMASMLNREIYGPLTMKQKEYLDIIHSSGQYLLSLVNEIVQLSELEETPKDLTLAPVDIEMVCQQVSNTLAQALHRRQQQIRLSVEPGRRVGLLDKSKIHQMLYHLVFYASQSSTAGSTIRLHASWKKKHLNLTVWVFHPWLDEDITCADRHPQPSLVSSTFPEGSVLMDYPIELETIDRETDLLESNPEVSAPSATLSDNSIEINSTHLGLLLCRQLAELHGGQLLIQARLEAGYRYVISLPQTVELEPD